MDKGGLFGKVKEIIDGHDPVGLLEMGLP